jgi:hypothetical protein
MLSADCEALDQAVGLSFAALAGALAGGLHEQHRMRQSHFTYSTTTIPFVWLYMLLKDYFAITSSPKVHFSPIEGATPTPPQPCGDHSSTCS